MNCDYTLALRYWQDTKTEMSLTTCTNNYTLEYHTSAIGTVALYSPRDAGPRDVWSYMYVPILSCVWHGSSPCNNWFDI